MAGFSDYLENEILDHIMISAASWTITSPCYIRLYSTSPNWDTGSGGTEITVANGYDRKSLTMSSANWSAAADDTNGVACYISANQDWTATGDWSGTVVGCGIWDAATGGNLYYGNDLAVSKTVTSGDTFRIPATTGFVVSVDKAAAAGFSHYIKHEILDHVTKSDASWSAPAHTHWRLYTAAPDLLLGTGGTEVTGGSYSRIEVTANSTNWNTAASGSLTLKADQTFTTSTASWGTVLATAAFDDTETNLIWADSYTGVPVGIGDVFKHVATTGVVLTWD